MPAWKKIIISGSDAALNSLYISNGLIVSGSTNLRGNDNGSLYIDSDLIPTVSFDGTQTVGFTYTINSYSDDIDFDVYYTGESGSYHTELSPVYQHINSGLGPFDGITITTNNGITLSSGSVSTYTIWVNVKTTPETWWSKSGYTLGQIQSGVQITLSGNTSTTLGTATGDLKNAGFATGSNPIPYPNTFRYQVPNPISFIGDTRITGSLYVSNGIYGNLTGSSSYAITASLAFTASYAATSSLSLATTENRIIAINKSGATITKGMVVHLTGSNNSSDTPYIITASYENDTNSANTLGIASQTIPFNSTGYVTTEGVITGINVTGFISGQVLYLGATGSIIGYAPTAPLHAVRLGQVVRDSPSNNGSIYVRIDNGYEIGELHDVSDTTTSGSFGDLLVKSGSIWINSKNLTGSYGITGSLNVSGSSAFKFSSLGTDQFTIDGVGTTRYFVVENSNGFVGIGQGYTTSARPSSSVDIRGNTNIRGLATSTGSIFTVSNISSSVLFTVSSSGFVGINKSNPTTHLDISGSMLVTGSASITGRIGIGVDTPTAKIHIKGEGNTSGTYNTTWYNSNNTWLGGMRDDGLFALFAFKRIYMNDVHVGEYGTNNTVLGYYAGGTAGYNGGEQNTTVGHYALFAPGASAIQNTAIGYYAGHAITTGQGNVFVGRWAGVDNTTGAENMYLGNNAGQKNSVGSENVAIGTSALNAAQSSSYNVAIGNQAAALLTTGSYNTYVGRSAGANARNTNYNTTLGYAALFGNHSGSENVAIGVYAGAFLTNGSTSNTQPTQSIYIGSYTEASSPTEQNAIVIGHGAEGLGSNTVVLGNDSVTLTALKGNVAIGKITTNAKLDVSGSVIVSGSGTTDTTKALQILNKNLSSSLTVFDSNEVSINNNTPGLGSQFSVDSYNSNYTRITYRNLTNVKLELGYGVTGYGFTHPTGEYIAYGTGLYFGQLTGASPTAFFSTQGNVGIGETTLGARLHIKSSGATSTSRAVQVDNSNGTSLFTIRDDGNVGIGVTSPSYKLDISGGVDLIRLRSSSYTTDIYEDTNFHIRRNAGTGLLYLSEGWTATVLPSLTSYTTNTDFGGDINIYNGKTITTYTGSATGANGRWDASTGNLSLGKTTANAKLDVNGSVIVTGSLNVTAGITGSLLGTASYADYATTASYALNVGSGGFPYIGTAEISGSLDVSGSINITHGLKLNQLSLTKTSFDTITGGSVVDTSCNEVLAQFRNFRSMHIKYNIQDSTGGNYRAGNIVAITDGTGSVQYNETTTMDIGNTAGIILSVVQTNSNNNLTLNVNNTTGNNVDLVTEYTML